MSTARNVIAGGGGAVSIGALLAFWTQVVEPVYDEHAEWRAHVDAHLPAIEWTELEHRITPAQDANGLEWWWLVRKELDAHGHKWTVHEFLWHDEIASKVVERCEADTMLCIEQLGGARP